MKCKDKVLDKEKEPKTKSNCTSSGWETLGLITANVKTTWEAKLMLSLTRVNTEKVLTKKAQFIQLYIIYNEVGLQSSTPEISVHSGDWQTKGPVEETRTNVSVKRKESEFMWWQSRLGKAG